VKQREDAKINTGQEFAAAFNVVKPAKLGDSEQ